MGRVREHEVGGGARLLATALSSGVLLVGILGWMVAVGTMASPGGRFGGRARAFRGVPFPGRGGVRRGRVRVSSGRGRGGGIAGASERRTRRHQRSATKPPRGGGTRTRRIPARDASGARPRTDHEARKKTRVARRARCRRALRLLRRFTRPACGRRRLGSPDRSPPGIVPRRSASPWKSCARAWRVTSRRISTGWSGAELPRLGQDVATGERRERAPGKRRGVGAAAAAEDADAGAADDGDEGPIPPPRAVVRPRVRGRGDGSIGPGAVKRRWCASSSTRPR